MSSQLESIYSDELILLAETLGEVKTRTEKLEGEFSTHAKPLEAATNALSAALSGIKALQFHVLDNNLGALSARVEEMRKAVDEQVGVIALELKKADETNAAKAGADAEALRSEIVALQSQLGSLVTQFGQQLERVEFAAKEEAKKLQLIPGPAGAAGASLNPRSTFIDGETYNRLDVVSWLGSSYIATVDGVKEKPSKNSNQWQTLASRGGGGAGGVGDFGSLAGVAQINQGGTGQTTRAAALNALLPDQAGSTQYMLLTDGSGNVSWGAQPVAGLPSQTSNSGRLLTTNGTTASWSNAVTVSGSNATVGGTLTVNSTDDASNKDTGSLVLEGGLGVEKNIVSGLGLSVRGAVTLPTAWTGAYGLGFEYGSAISRVFFGDGTGYTLKFVSRASSTTTDRMTLTDSGNLTVGGALTVSGTTTADGLATSGFFGGSKRVILGYNTSSDYGFIASVDTGVGWKELQLNPSGGLVKVPSTTGSTSTSSGALVVGNGTSGGLGVGGAIYAGGVISTTSSSGVAVVGGRQWSIRANSALGSPPSAFVIRDDSLGSERVTIDASGNIAALSTTASTSTSSGALVVSGGVGVAGAIYAGGNVESSGGADFTSVAASFARISTVASAPRLTLVRSGSTSNRRAFDIINNADGLISMRFINDDLSGSTLAATISYTGDFRITGTLQVGNTYASGAPTATGYIVIKDSTGTSYKIPAQAL
jgi:hypothetical protein